MPNDTRLEAFGHPGIQVPPPFPYHRNADAAWRYALTQAPYVTTESGAPFDPLNTSNPAVLRPGGITKLVRHSDQPVPKKDEDIDGPAPGIGLAFKVVYPTPVNIKQAWRADVGGSTYLETIGKLQTFTGNLAGLWHSNGAANREQSYTSLASEDETSGLYLPLILRNSALALRFFLPKPPDTQSRPIYVARWGSGASHWQFQVADGQASIMRLAPVDAAGKGWTQTKENRLNELLGQETTTAAEDAEIDSLRAEIYRDVTPIDFSQGGQGWYGRAHELIFYPEPCGRIHVLNGTGPHAKRIIVEHSEIIASRRPGTVWGNSHLTLKSNGGMFYFQAGWCEHDLAGELRFGLITEGYFLGFLGGMILSCIKDVSLAGTAIEIVQETVGTGTTPNASKRELIAKFSTTNKRYSPWFYGLASHLIGAVRNGSTSTAWSSDDRRVGATPGVAGSGSSPIIDIEPQFDDNGRVSATVTLDDSHGRTLQGLDNEEILENRLGTLSIEDTPFISQGIIASATWSDASQFAQQDDAFNDGITHAEASQATTSAIIVMRDRGALLDEQECSDEVGDNSHLADFGRLILRNGGEPDALLGGIPTALAPLSTRGRLLPTATALDDGPLIRPGEGARRIQYLFEMGARWGLGRRFYLGADGIWYFGYPSTAVVASFSSDSSKPGGTYPIVCPLDRLRDTEASAVFYNVIRVTGRDARGNAIVREARINRSVTSTSPLKKSFVGRLKPLEVKEPGARTASEVAYVLRSLRTYHNEANTSAGFRALTPRFVHFQTTWLPTAILNQLRPNVSLIRADGVLCLFRNFTGGSMQNNELSLFGQEVEE